MDSDEVFDEFILVESGSGSSADVADFVGAGAFGDEAVELEAEDVAIGGKIVFGCVIKNGVIVRSQSDR